MTWRAGLAMLLVFGLIGAVAWAVARNDQDDGPRLTLRPSRVTGDEVVVVVRGRGFQPFARVGFAASWLSAAECVADTGFRGFGISRSESPFAVADADGSFSKELQFGRLGPPGVYQVFVYDYDPQAPSPRSADAGLHYDPC